MKVLVVGYSKTGTKSMSSALRKLGYNNYDYDATSFYLGDDWIKIINKGGTKEDFYRMYKDVDSSTDAPAYMFWPEILEAFPDTKLIFTVRDEDSWVRSMSVQLDASARDYGFQILALFSPTARKFYRFTNPACRLAFGIPDATLYFNTLRGHNPTVLRKLYREHNSHILMNAPKDQLLVYSVKEGWEPLCKFLGKPVPEVPFPHKNVGSTVMDDYKKESPSFQVMKREAVISLCLYVAIIAVAISWLFLL